MTIKTRIRQTQEFSKLLDFLDSSHPKKEKHTCTISGTTTDTQEIILELLQQSTKKAIIYSEILNFNTFEFIESTQLHTKVSFHKLKSLLKSCHFERVEKLLNKSHYSIKGDTITFWPSIYTHPIRASFIGNKCESIDIIDEVYHTVIAKLAEIAIGDEIHLEDNIERQKVKILCPKLHICDKYLHFSKHTDNRLGKQFKFNFHFSYPTLFFNRLDLLKKEIGDRENNGWFIKISSKHSGELPYNLGKYATSVQCKSGFENKSSKIALYTDRELFGTIFLASEKTKNNTSNKYLAQLEGEIQVGNYIVHEDYGIAAYKGIKQKKVLDKFADYLILEYAEGDKLFVPIDQVHKLTKYIGSDHTPPRITRLGKTNWHILKRKVKQSIVLLAKELLEHYAKLELTKGVRFAKHEWEDKFASEFEFTETPDQTRVGKEITTDLESSKIMNRLLIGDVGFGKTEMAVRAAFKTALNNKQVAILCPTTILVSQHFTVFKHRMQDYPVAIATLSRFGTRADNNKVIEKLGQGNIDIVIGTHRLLSDDLRFRNLGLLIIDEEQRFGVKQKEKIKKLAYTCNVLSMSATPIPRTMSMALSKIKDISLITTSPPNRKSIKTYLSYFDWHKVIEAISKEVNRNGQVYFLHNQVRTIESIKYKLQQYLPNIRFETAHGQMHPATLDKIMRKFYNHEFDCLICTTIIENGIDIKNVNTMIINKAQNLGLAQLYQLRGRIGRSRRQAYCHLFYTEKSIFNNSNRSNNSMVLNKRKAVPFAKAKMRLKAILESQELGSGFKIASRDLEIRGAGNLLGRKQHGNIINIGLGLYMQLLAGEIERLKKLNRKVPYFAEAT